MSASRKAERATDEGRDDGPTPIGLLQALGRAAPRLEALARHDDEASRFPGESLAILHDLGLMTAFAPVRCGGMDPPPASRIEAMMKALRLVGRADLSLGRIFEGHVNALELFRWYGSGPQLAVLASDLRQARTYGVWASEPPPGVRLAADGATLTGTKSFATGAGSIDRAIVTVASAGPRRLAIVPANLAGRTDASGWRVRGMKATVSGRYDLDALAVDDDMLLGEPGDYDREPRFTAGAWRFCAVQLGGVERIVQLVRSAMSEAARADPLARAQFGAAIVAARTAYLWVREAARQAAEEQPTAAAFALMTRGVVERAGLDATELAARIVGTRAFATGSDLDLVCRNLGLYLRQAGPDHARDRAAASWLETDIWAEDDRLW